MSNILRRRMSWRGRELRQTAGGFGRRGTRSERWIAARRVPAATRQTVPIVTVGLKKLDPGDRKE
jgi:hypothetical protein